MSTVTAPKPAAGRGPKASTKTAAKTTAKVTKASKGNAKTAAAVKTRTRAPKGQGYADHRFERKSEEVPCKACDTPYLHSKGFCSPCYNAARKPMKAGKTGIALINAVREVRGVKPTPAQKRRDAKLAKAAA